MVSDLKNTWKNHAFPDEHNGKEVYGVESSAHRRDEIRREIYLEQTTNYRMRRHTHDDDTKSGSKSSKQRDLDDLMLLAVGSPAYMQAYSHQLSFTINGQGFEISQGSLYETSKQYALNLRNEINNAKKGKLDPSDITLMTAELGHVEQIIEISDPQRGVISDEDTVRVREHLEQSEGLQKEIVNYSIQSKSPEVTTSQAENSYRGNFDSQTDDMFALIESVPATSSFANSVNSSPLNTATASASTAFNHVAQHQDSTSPESPSLATSPNSTGFTI